SNYTPTHPYTHTVLLHVMGDNNGFRDLAHALPGIHALELDSAEGLLFLETVLVHQDSLSAVHRFPGLQLIFKVLRLFLQLKELLPPANCDLYCRQEIRLSERFHKV